jgi:hypothetical protein
MVWMCVAVIGCTGGTCGCGARVTVDGQCEDGGAAGADGGGAGGGGQCDWVSECAADVDKKAQKVACDDGNPKTVDRCVAVGDIGGVCAHTDAECDNFDPMPVQEATCDDGDIKTVDRCTQWNACLSKSPL